MPLQVFQAVEALAAQNIQSEKEVAFLKSKAVIISKLFLNSDVPPKSRIRCWDPPRKAEGCCLPIAQDHRIAAASSCGERGTRQRFGSAPAKHAVKLHSMLWRLGTSTWAPGKGNRSTTSSETAEM